MEPRYEGILVMPLPIRLHDRAYLRDRPWPDPLLMGRLCRRQSCLNLPRAESGRGSWLWRMYDLPAHIAVAEGPHRCSGGYG